MVLPEYMDSHIKKQYGGQLKYGRKFVKGIIQQILAITVHIFDTSMKLGTIVLFGMIQTFSAQYTLQTQGCAW